MAGPVKCFLYKDLSSVPSTAGKDEPGCAPILTALGRQSQKDPRASQPRLTVEPSVPTGDPVSKDQEDSACG